MQMMGQDICNETKVLREYNNEIFGSEEDK